MIGSCYAFDCNQFSGLDRDNCLSLNSVDESLIANLIYKNTSSPDHAFVSQYNQQIQVTNPPNNTLLYNKGVINNAWISILTISPSIKYQNTIYVPEATKYRAEYNHSIVIPSNYYNSNKVAGQTCQILYSKDKENSELSWTIDNTLSGTGKNIQIISTNYSTVKATANIDVTRKADNYKWQRYCCAYTNGRCSKYCYNCKFSSTTYTTDSLSIIDSVSVKNYNHQPTSEFTIVDNYSGTYKGILSQDNETNSYLTFNNSFVKDNKYVYSANFSKQPYNFIYLVAERRDLHTEQNLFSTNGTIYVSDSSNCTLLKYDFFTSNTQKCEINISQKTNAVTSQTSFEFSLSFLFKLAVFIFILYVIYKLIKQYWGKALMPVACFLLIAPAVRAEDCGITNLASCIPQKIYDFFLNLLNAPLEPLLSMVKNLLSAAPSITLFQGVWAIIIYCISLFYGLLFVYAGYLFLFSGHDVIKREMAKEWLKNTVIMIVLIQASFYLYGLILELGSIMTSSILSMVDPHFFMLTADNLANVGLELIFVLSYVLVLLLTLLFLTLRYLVVAFGVLLVPIGIFCYFIPPLKSYGKLIVHLLGMLIFVTFLDAVIILACSMLISLPLFQNFKILVMITCFTIIIILFLILSKHIMHKTSLDEGAEKIGQAAKYIGMML